MISVASINLVAVHVSFAKSTVVWFVIVRPVKATKFLHKCGYVEANPSLSLLSSLTCAPCQGQLSLHTHALRVLRPRAASAQLRPFTRQAPGPCGRCDEVG